MISEEHFNAWKLDPMTQELMKMLHAKREELRQEWEHGRSTDWAIEGFALANMGNIGMCRGMALVTDLTYEELATELGYDEKPKRTDPSGGRGPDQAV